MLCVRDSSQNSKPLSQESTSPENDGQVEDDDDCQGYKDADMLLRMEL